MKKTISFILTFALCAGVLFLFGSCQKGDASKAEYNGIVENVGSKFGTVNEEDLENVEAQGSDKSSDAALYNDAAINTGFVIDKKTKSAAHTRYVITDAICKDVDGDGREEVFTMGISERNGKLTVDYFDYVETFFDEETKMRTIASVTFDASLCLGFSDDEDGTVHLIQYADNTKKTVKEDLGSLSVNGVSLDVGKKAVSDAAGKPDMSIFPDMTGKVYTYNGKEYKASADFIYKPADTLDVYISCEAIEKVTGQKTKTSAADENIMAFMTIYGKKYVHLSAVEYYYDNLKADIGEGSVAVVFSAKNNTTATTAAKAQ